MEIRGPPRTLPPDLQSPETVARGTTMCQKEHDLESGFLTNSHRLVIRYPYNEKGQMGKREVEGCTNPKSKAAKDRRVRLTSSEPRPRFVKLHPGRRRLRWHYPVPKLPALGRLDLVQRRMILLLSMGSEGLRVQGRGLHREPLRPSQLASRRRTQPLFLQKDELVSKMAMS